MPVFRENPNKLKLNLSKGSNKVRIKVDCFFGTQALVSFFHNSLKSLSCGDTKEVDISSSLKGQSVIFDGAANNPSGGQIKITHTIWEENGNKVIYTIPDDYTGEPTWAPEKDNPSYEFQVNFL